MAVQQRRTSKHRRDKRRSHHALQTTAVMACRNCGAMKRLHRVCACGMYRGKHVLTSK